MKNNIILIFLIIVLMPCIALGGEQLLLREQFVFRGIKPIDKMSTVVAGIDLAKYGYTEIIEYALVNSNYLYFMGLSKDRTGRDQFSIAVFKLKNQKLSVIKELEDPFRIYHNKPTFLIFFDPNVKMSEPYVVFQYAEDGAGPGAMLYVAIHYIEIYKRGKDNAYIVVARKKIGESNISLDKRKKSDYKYLKAVLDPEESGKKEPAVIILPKIIIGDYGPDGFADILIWRKTFLSKSVGEKGDPFMLNNEDIMVMYYDSQTANFSDLRKINLDILDKDKILWEIIPSVEGYHGFKLNN